MSKKVIKSPQTDFKIKVNFATGASEQNSLKRLI